MKPDPLIRLKDQAQGCISPTYIDVDLAQWAVREIETQREAVQLAASYIGKPTHGYEGLEDDDVVDLPSIKARLGDVKQINAAAERPEAGGAAVTRQTVMIDGVGYPVHPNVAHAIYQLRDSMGTVQEFVDSPWGNTIRHDSLFQRMISGLRRAEKYLRRA